METENEIVAMALVRNKANRKLATFQHWVAFFTVHLISTGEKGF